MSLTTFLYRFLVRGGTAAALASRNEVPLAREFEIETDTQKFKLGDGATPYNSLLYVLRDDTITLADVTTNNATTGRHGFLKKLPNDSSKFMDGLGNWSVPSATGAVVGTVRRLGATVSTTSFTVTATIPYDNTKPQNTEGAALSAIDTTVTPNNASSTITITVILSGVSMGPSADGFMVTLYRDTGVDAIAVAMKTIAGNTQWGEAIIVFPNIPAVAAAATTFKVRLGVQDNTWTLYGLRATSGDKFNGTLFAAMLVDEVTP